MNTPEGENAPLLRAPPRRPSYAAPSSVRNGVAATLVAGCVVATLAVSGRLGTEPARVDRAATATSRPRAAQMGVAPNEPGNAGELGNFFTDAWDSTVGELMPSFSSAEPAPAPEGPRPLDADAGGPDAEAPDSDFYPGVEGCEATCESDDVTSEADCVAIGPFCEWGEGKCWSAVGPDPCPTDWGDDADAPAPSEPETKKKKKKKKKGDEAPAPSDDFADAPAPSDAFADAPAPLDAFADAPAPLDAFADAPAPADDSAEAPEPAPEVDLLGELETVYGDDGATDAKKTASKQREKFDALDDDLNDTRRHTKDTEDDLSKKQKLKHIEDAIERGPKHPDETTKKSSKTISASNHARDADAHPTGSITPKKVPIMFEAEVFRGDITEGVSDDVLADIVRTKMSDNQYEGLFEDLEVKRFEFRVSFDVTVAGAACPRVSDAAFAEGVKAFVKQARADDAIARFGEDERTPLEKVTERNSKPAREPEMHDDLDGALLSMKVGGCEDVPVDAAGPEQDSEKDDTKAPLTASKHKFKVELVIPRAGPETNAAEMTNRVGNLFDTAHVKKQLEAAHVDKKREDATDVSIDNVTIHGKISVAEKPKKLR